MQGTRVWLKDAEVVWKPGVVAEAFDGKRLLAVPDDDPTEEVEVKVNDKATTAVADQVRSPSSSEVSCQLLTNDFRAH